MLRYKICPVLFLLLALCSVVSGSHAQNGARPSLLRNGGFEGGRGDDKGSGVPFWEPFGTGYDIDRENHHEGDQSIRCDSVSSAATRGAVTTLELKQTHATPILITGWSKAEQVGGSKDGNYAIYVDLTYMDGTPLWGQIAPFQVGTHGWERKQLLLLPTKPIKSVTLYALFRSHVGTVWFDDFAATAQDGADQFDSQRIRPTPLPQDKVSKLHIAAKDGLTLDFNAAGDILGVRTGAQDVSSASGGGFFVRDVSADGPLIPLRGTAAKYGDGARILSDSRAAHMSFNGKILQHGDSLMVDGDLTDQLPEDRAITVYFVLPIHADGWQWGQDIRHAETVAVNHEYSNQVQIAEGATGGLSLYPFGCVSNANTGVGIANQMDWPSVYRIFYNGTNRQLVIAWDFAMTAKTSAWPPHNVRFWCHLFRLPPQTAEWGFRAAAQRYYEINRHYTERHATAEGIWMPFTDPSTVPKPQDFGFAYHEGDNSLKSDDALGILSFRYTEPQSWWMPMPKDAPRTYETAVALLHEYAESSDPVKRENARSVLDCGTQDSDGKFNLLFEDAPWNSGAVFQVNPNPEIASTPEKPTKASVNYTMARAAVTYSEATAKTRGAQDGEYLDSLEAWADVQDYRPSNLLSSPYPLPFDTDSHRPTLPLWYSVHSFVRFLHDDLHNRNKLLMANSTPIRFSIFSAQLDIMGIEVNWLDGDGNYAPESDETMNMRRTLSAQKPYLLLMNTDFNKFTAPMVEKYFQRSMFYGIYPSMFSVNAADSPYWENPKWYDRDRPLFKKYIPVIQKLSAAGWQPIPYARSTNPAIFVERFGHRYLTVLNASKQPQDTTLTLDLHGIGEFAFNVRIVDAVTGVELPSHHVGNPLAVPLHLAPDQAFALEIVSR